MRLPSTVGHIQCLNLHWGECDSILGTNSSLEVYRTLADRAE